MARPERIYSGAITDSSRWARLALRAGDVVICTPPKSGTTYTQAICALLILGPGFEGSVSSHSPWLDCGPRDFEDIRTRLEAQEHRRFIKTHTPLDGLPEETGVTYLCVYRHPLDVHFSMRNHIVNMTRDSLDPFYPDDFDVGFRIFLEGDPDGPEQDAPCLAAIARHYREAERRAAAANVHLLHYSVQRADPAAAVAAVAAALGIALAPGAAEALGRIVSFDNMKANAEVFAPYGGQGTWRSDAAFFESGSERKWEGRLSPAQLAAYDAAMDRLLPPAARAWLEWGPGGAP